jgi:hypothetical protein
MSKRLILLLAAVMALAVVAAGCGSSSDDDSTEGAVALTKAEFIKQGDQICKQAGEDSQAEAEEFADENDFELEKASKEQLEEAIDQVLVPVLNNQVEEIKALGAPEGDEDQVEAILVALEDGSDEVAADPSRAFEADPLKQAKRLAQGYGFKVCGE